MEEKIGFKGQVRFKIIRANPTLRQRIVDWLRGLFPA